MSANDLVSMSADELEALANKASQIASDLRKIEPSYFLAIQAGVKNRSYQTVNYGKIPSYSGSAIITMDDGSRWKAIGHPAIKREGYIEFIPLSD